MDSFLPHLQWIDSQSALMLQTLCRWAAINSGTLNLPGLSRLAHDVESEFKELGDARFIEVPPVESIDSHGNVSRAALGRVVQIQSRHRGEKRVLLCIHLDTVYPHDHHFQTVRQTDADTLHGPGVADAKGGLVVLLTALRAFCRSEYSGKLGWEVLLVPDEEIGSPGSRPLLIEAAGRSDIGLVFEPALPDGSLVGARKGSGGFTFVIRGRAAHAGRDFHTGRSAIVAMSRLIARLDESSQKLGGGVTINCGQVEGGGAVNVVPDLAIARFNVRVSDASEMQTVERLLKETADDIGRDDGIRVELHGGFASPPKPLDDRTQRLADRILACGRELGLNLSLKPSGGTCDGNKLAAAGLAVIDSVGPVGGEIHSDREFVRISSLAERAKLVGLFLMRFAMSSAP